MKGQLKVKTPAQYLKAVDAKRRPDVGKLHKLIVKETKLKPYIQMGVLGYGSYHYKYASGREGDWPCIALASNAQYISLYACAYKLDAYKARLPKANVGKSCIRFKKLGDVDLKVLARIVKEAAKTDGRTVSNVDAKR